MKTKLLLLLLLANFSIYAQTNLVPNGGFETWTSSSQPDNWYRYFSGFVSQSATSQNGASSINMMVASGTFNYINSEYFPVTANKTYRVTLYHKTVKGTFSSVDLSLYHKPSTFKQEIIKKSDITFSTTEWRKIEFEYTPTVSENVEVDIWTTGSLNSEILVDNVSVVDVNESVAQYTIIPDVNFENKLISLGLDFGIPDGKVLTSNIASQTDLSVRNSSITNLTGIEGFTELNSLDITKNQIVNLDLSQNTKLVQLYAGENKLTSLDITSNTQLKSLDCQKNQLTSLNLSNNINLTSLNLATNQITSLDVSNNTALISLTCGSNKLTNLNIDKNTALTDLRCGNNLLTSLNVSKNLLLVYLICQNNQITSLDVSNNVELDQLMFHYNKVKTIDISHNPKLTYFDCLFNELTSIDISNNPKIFEVACENNQLTYLNLKNGNNLNFDLVYSNFKNNPNLTCIQVDDVAYSEAKWSALKDSNASYSSSCALGLEDSVFNKITMYPNPTKGELNINNIPLEKATVYNSLGKLVKSFTLNSGNTNNTLNLSGLPKGVYYVYLINQDAASAKKVIIE